MSAEPAQLAVLRDALRRWLADRGVTGAAVDDVLIGVGEAAANAIEHAYAGGPGGLLTVEIEVADPDGGTLVVTVRDRGRWRVEQAGAADRGRGIAMMRAVGSDVRYDRRDGGTTVRFVIAGCAPQAGPGRSEPASP